MPIIQTNKPLRPRQANDYYATPYGLIHTALGLLKHRRYSRVLDPGSGSGRWGWMFKRSRWSAEFLCGIDPYFSEPADNSYDLWYHADYVTQNFWNSKFQLIIGNPPYRFSEKFVAKSFDLLAAGGEMLLLLPISFLASQHRAKKFWPKFMPNDVYVLARRPSFTNNGGTDSTEYALYYWHKNFWIRPSTFTGHLLNWDYIPELDLTEKKR